MISSLQIHHKHGIESYLISPEGCIGDALTDPPTRISLSVVRYFIGFPKSIIVSGVCCFQYSELYFDNTHTMYLMHRSISFLIRSE